MQPVNNKQKCVSFTHASAIKCTLMLKMKILQISAQKLVDFSLEHKDILAFRELPIVNVNKRNFGDQIITVAARLPGDIWGKNVLFFS